MSLFKSLRSKIFGNESKPDEAILEPLFLAISNQDPEWLATVREARASVHQLRSLYSTLGEREPPVYFSIKAALRDGNGGQGNIWLLIKQLDSDGFFAAPFELPKEFTSVKVGEVIFVPETALLDWMVNEDGVLHGGFSLRYQRSRLPTEQHAAYDAHVGVTEYA